MKFNMYVKDIKNIESNDYIFKIYYHVHIFSQN